MKVKASIKKRSEDGKIGKRKGRLYGICKQNPKFKQRQGCSVEHKYVTTSTTK